MAEFNFNKINIPTMRVILNDAEQTELSVKMPETYIIQNIIECQKLLEEVKEMDTSTFGDVIEKILDIISAILSNNKEHIKVTRETLVNLGLGLDETALLFAEYLTFVDENTPKN